jgi:putative membrane protein
MIWRKQQHSTIKGLAAGAIGGLVASWIMGYVHAALGASQQQGGERDSQASGRHNQQQQQQQQGGGEDATVKTAVAVAEGVFHHPLPEEKKKTAGSIVHYAFGTVVGGLYGMAAEQWRPARWGEGALFGAAVWTGADEIAVPALKLAKKPREYPLKVHAGALASHVVYGVTTELVRRGLRAGVLSR